MVSFLYTAQLTLLNNKCFQHIRTINITDVILSHEFFLKVYFNLILDQSMLMIFDLWRWSISLVNIFIFLSFLLQATSPPQVSYCSHLCHHLPAFNASISKESLFITHVFFNGFIFYFHSVLTQIHVDLQVFVVCLLPPCPRCVALTRQHTKDKWIHTNIPDLITRNIKNSLVNAHKNILQHQRHFFV